MGAVTERPHRAPISWVIRVERPTIEPDVGAVAAETIVVSGGESICDVVFASSF